MHTLPHAVPGLLWGVCAAAYSLPDIAIDQRVDMIDQGRLVPSFLSHFKTLDAPGSYHGAKTFLTF
jgi:hypothetical protein